jgi:hypothetical protein
VARFCHQRNEHFKRAGLHYIAFSEQRGSKSETCAHGDLKNRCIRRFRDELRLAQSSISGSFSPAPIAAWLSDLGNSVVSWRLLDIARCQPKMDTIELIGQVAEATGRQPGNNGPCRLSSSGCGDLLRRADYSALRPCKCLAVGRILAAPCCRERRLRWN